MIQTSLRLLRSSLMPVLVLLTLAELASAETVTPFVPSAAANYAHSWYNNRNTSFPNWADGTTGDCTNFASQCLLAGFCGSYAKTTVYNARLNYQDKATSSNDWWFTSSSSRATPEWAGADGLYKYLTIQAANPRILGIRVSKIQSGGAPNVSNLRVGRIVSLVDDAGKGRHSLIVTVYPSKPTVDNVMVAYRNVTEASCLEESVKVRNSRQPWGWHVWNITGFAK